MEAFRKIYPSEFYKKFLVHGVRPDGRSLQKVRKTRVSAGSIGSAEGSAFVRMGNSSVLAAVSAMVPVQPQTQPEIFVNVELGSICSTRFRGGKPSEQSQVLSQLLTEIANSILKMDELVILKGEEEEGMNIVWFLYVDIYCLNYDGNVFDSALLALVAALKNAKIPANKIVEGKVYTLPDAPAKELTLLHSPASLSFALLEDYLVADPTSEEEELMSSLITIIYTEDQKLFSVLKPGGVSLAEEQLKECMQLAKQRVPHVLQLLHRNASIFSDE